MLRFFFSTKPIIRICLLSSFRGIRFQAEVCHRSFQADDRLVQEKSFRLILNAAERALASQLGMDEIRNQSGEKCPCRFLAA